MLRMIGLVLGTLMLVNGITDTVNPHLGFSIWERSFRRYLPEQVNSVVGEYSRLSDTARRYVSVWEALTAFMLLLLAFRSRD